MILFKQPYFTVHREICDFKQHIIQKNHFMHVYKEKIVTVNKTFPLKDIQDVSYRQISREIGMIYLHTDSKVYTFKVREHPQRFLEWFHKFKRQYRK